ncbi:TraR/DksA family transcriptional regulator [Streptomyces sp. TRM70308]|uniref:TraR/DksA family transcriptional regulator n=1 Tax=Streptomyces sp. TRM70308 TaxID=3131932 RepID=UPI003D08AA5A
MTPAKRPPADAAHDADEPAAKTPAKRAAEEKAPTDKAPAEKAPAKRAPAGRAAAKKAPAKGGPAARARAAERPPAKPAGTSAHAAREEPVPPTGAAARRAAAERAPAKKTGAKRTAADGAPAEEAAGQQAAARKPAAPQAPTGAGRGRDTVGREAAQRETGAEAVAAKKTTTGTHTAVPQARVAAAPDELAVRTGEDPWTESEVDEARTELATEVDRLRAEIDAVERGLAGLMRDSGDGAGDDQADTGTKNVTREHEMAIAENAREMMYQSERALERLEAGTYGLCENCGNPIGKARMQAFPRATLCVECKQKQERH